MPHRGLNAAEEPVDERLFVVPARLDAELGENLFAVCLEDVPRPRQADHRLMDGDTSRQHRRRHQHRQQEPPLGVRPDRLGQGEQADPQARHLGRPDQRRRLVRRHGRRDGRPQNQQTRRNHQPGGRQRCPSLGHP